MHAPSPHYLLYSEAGASAGGDPRWRFLLQPIDGDQTLVAADSEPGTNPNRLELLAAVRGLEALEQPSRVTLLTRSRYVSRGIRNGLGPWRERKWQWERFGQLVAIRDQDLWQRIDRALQFHQVECCPSPFDEDADDAAVAQEAADAPTVQNVRSDDAKQSHPRRQRPAAAMGMRRPTNPKHGRFSRTISRLRLSVLTPLASIWRPAFTRAA